jgi:hypothetical protein
MPSSDLPRPLKRGQNVIPFARSTALSTGSDSAKEPPRRLALAALLAFRMPLTAEHRLALIAELLYPSGDLDV